MNALAATPGASYKTLACLRYLEDLPDPRKRGKAMVPLYEVLLLALVAVPAEAWTVVDIARFSAKKLPVLRRLGLFAWFIRSGD